MSHHSGRAIAQRHAGSTGATNSTAQGSSTALPQVRNMVESSAAGSRSTARPTGKRIKLRGPEGGVMVKTYGNTFVQKLEDLPQAVGPRFYSSIALNPYTPPRTEFWVTDDCSAPGVALGGPRIELQRKKMDLPSVLAALPKTGTKTLQFSGKWEKSPTNGLWILRYICFDPDWDPERLYYLHCHDILGLGVYRVCEQRERAPNEQNVLQGHSALLILKGDIDFERRMRQGVGDLDKLSDVQTYTAQVARDLGRTALPTLYVSILSPVPYSDMRLSQWLQATASAHP